MPCQEWPVKCLVRKSGPILRKQSHLTDHFLEVTLFNSVVGVILQKLLILQLDLLLAEAAGFHQIFQVFGQNNWLQFTISQAHFLQQI